MKAFVSGLVLAFLVGLIGIGPLFHERIEQPIQFNHQAHADIDCSGCHETVADESFASWPSLETCMICHETPMSESPEEEKVRTFASRQESIPWQRLFRQPSYVFYSHRRHVGIAGMECEECHPGIGTAAAPPPSVRNLTMDDCIGCHEERGVEAGCVDCHR